MGKGGEHIGKGAGKGAASMAKGAAEAAADLMTLHPVDAGASLGKGTDGLGKDVGDGTAKGEVKIGKGAGGEVGKLGEKVVPHSNNHIQISGISQRRDFFAHSKPNTGPSW